MDTKRFLLAIGLTLLVLWLYETWLEYQYPEYSQGQQVAEQEAEEEAKRQSAPDARDSAGASAESGDESRSGADVPKVSQNQEESSPAQPAESLGSAPGPSVSTDLLRVVFGKRSGDPIRAETLRHRQDDKAGSPPVAVLQPEGPQVVVVESGWQAQELPAPGRDADFTTDASGELGLDPGQDRIAVNYTHTRDGLEFRKTYRLRRGSYQVTVDYTVINRSDAPWQGHLFGHVRERGSKPGGNWLLAGFSYDGPVVFTGEDMQTYSHDALLERQGQGFQKRDPDGWAGIMSRYFLAAWLPDSGQDNLIYAQASGPDSFAGYSSPFPRVAPGDKVSVQETLYLGPKEQSVLNQVGRNLRRSVDYGILSFLAIPLFEVLQFFHGLVGNYGFAIILVTLLIKVIFFPLFSMSYRAMAKMRKVQPELQRLREQYGDDRQKLNEEMMRLYREEKVNPLGGCLPILVQIPVFISLYWVLLESVEIRHEPFILWITDLTSQDPFYVLPVLMGASMVVQQLMNPAPLDPIQKKVMLALPVVFTLFFMQFPAGLVLYWLSNNLISIGQQWWIMRKIG
ncbi:membrane protein insertase YidC [Thiohalorhabdus sp.]|uniref:membrane protein insertase YidC n=1 Tax=Thiohalorhabdus sp. TaxID=3094134 RepID=UPI002FC30455